MRGKDGASCPRSALHRPGERQVDGCLPPMIRWILARSIRWARCTLRSKIPSATVASPICWPPESAKRPAWENGQCFVFSDINAHGVDFRVWKTPIKQGSVSAGVLMEGFWRAKSTLGKVASTPSILERCADSPQVKKHPLWSRRRSTLDGHKPVSRIPADPIPVRVCDDAATANFIGHAQADA